MPFCSIRHIFFLLFYVYKLEKLSRHHSHIAVLFPHFKPVKNFKVSNTFLFHSTKLFFSLFCLIMDSLRDRHIHISTLFPYFEVVKKNPKYFFHSTDLFSFLFFSFTTGQTSITGVTFLLYFLFQTSKEI